MDGKNIHVGGAYLRRRDAGGEHRSKVYKAADTLIRKYTIEGECVGEYSSIREALESLGGEGNYMSLYKCLTGAQKTYKGYLWRSNKGKMPFKMEG